MEAETRTPPHLVGLLRARSREEIDRDRKRESLQSTRRGLTRELQTCHSLVHRISLERAIEHIDRELASLV